MTRAKADRIKHTAQGVELAPLPGQPDLAHAAKLIAALAYREKYRKLESYAPYPKQAEFHALGSSKHEVALIAGNRVGKTYCAGAEFSMHLTGLYPDWWQGRRFTKPVRAWAAGLTGLVVRDVSQKILFGTPGVIEDRGTGLVPRECVDWNKGLSTARGYADAYDTVQVRHVSGGVSTCMFKSFEQGKQKFQGETLDLGWSDEEPEDYELYIEFLTRLATTGGLMMVTYTPLLGRTKLVERFMSEPSLDRAYVAMTIDDAQHFTQSERERIVASYPAYMRNAKARGEPMMGAGRVFETDEDVLKEKAVSPVPAYWRKLWAIDFGIDHPFAAVLLGYDADTDVVHILHALRMKDSRPIDHAAAMKPLGGDIPVAWPHDGSSRDKGSGETLASQYKKHGLKMLGTHAAFPDGSISTEAGLIAMDERMRSGRLKVAAHLADWFDEYRNYHRKPLADGGSEIVKMNDDLMSATRIGIMTLRSARAVGTGLESQRAQPVRIARDTDYDIFA